MILNQYKRRLCVDVIIISSSSPFFSVAQPSISARRALTTYGDKGIWKAVQSFLPDRLHSKLEHHPEEDWWESRGHIIDLDRWRNPEAKIKLILFHSIGTNGRQMSLILVRPLHEAGFELAAIGMPGYGQTKINQCPSHTYDNWVNIGNDFINHELQQDSSPVALCGLRAGGMEAYHFAAVNKKVEGVIGMTLMDTSNWKVRDQASRNIFMSRVGIPIAQFQGSILPFGDQKLPMWLVSRMSTLGNDPDAVNIMMLDLSCAGCWNTMRFRGSHTSYKPAMEPEEFNVCPILLTQPAEDKWTPQWISEVFLTRLNKVNVKIVEMENAGHYPLEDPGLQQMADAIIKFLHEITPS